MNYMQLFDLGPSGDQDDATIVIPVDSIAMDEKSRIKLIGKISICEGSGVELDTSVIDQLLSLFKNEEHFTFSTLSPLPGRMNPCQSTYIQ